MNNVNFPIGESDFRTIREDKVCLSEEIKKKQVNLQKTDFFTLIEKWDEN